jgi:hypothetical protein
LIYLSSDPSGMRSLVLSLTLPFPELHVRRSDMSGRSQTDAT